MIDDEIRTMIMNHEPINDVKQYTPRNKMIFLIDDGLLKAKKGLTQ